MPLWLTHLWLIYNILARSAYLLYLRYRSYSTSGNYRIASVRIHLIDGIGLITVNVNVQRLSYSSSYGFAFDLGYVSHICTV